MSNQVNKENSIKNTLMEVIQGANGENIHRQAFRLTFKDASTLRKTVNFPSFAVWMGQLREYAILSIAEQLIPDMKSGKWGMVTNKSELKVYGELNCFDIVEGRVWVDNKYGPLGSSADLVFDWLKVLDDGSYELIAQSKMATTWVSVISHGVVKVEKNPIYLEDLIVSMMPKAFEKKSMNDDFFKKSHVFKNVLTNLILKTNEGPGQQPILYQKIFSTSLEESNLVGNIYYSNYYKWQSIVRDSFFFEQVQEFFSGADFIGEFVCTDLKIGHLREAMPFDNIKVVMSLKSIYENGIKLYFEYFNVSGDKEVKLAFGEHQAFWVDLNNETRLPEVSKIPEKVIDLLSTYST